MLQVGFHGNRFLGGGLCAATTEGEKEPGLDRRGCWTANPTGNAGTDWWINRAVLDWGEVVGPLYPLRPPGREYSLGPWGDILSSQGQCPGRVSTESYQPLTLPSTGSNSINKRGGARSVWCAVSSTTIDTLICQQVAWFAFIFRRQYFCFSFD